MHWWQCSRWKPSGPSTRAESGKLRQPVPDNARVLGACENASGPSETLLSNRPEARDRDHRLVRTGYHSSSVAPLALGLPIISIAEGRAGSSAEMAAMISLGVNGLATIKLSGTPCDLCW